MHFTIPYNEEIVENDGKSVHIYKIYLNGAHLCSARYSKFHNMYCDLKSKFQNFDLPYFPPKKLLKLSKFQIQERKDHLEYFLQKVSSSNKLNSEIFYKFLKTCQKDTKRILPEAVALPIYLLNGEKYELEIQSPDLTQTVLNNFGSYLGIPRSIINKFGLFLVRFHNDREISIVRQLQEFEYPIISLREMELFCNCRLVIRKQVWDIEQDNYLLTNKASMDILYSQVLGEMKYNLLKLPNDSRRDRFNNLIQSGAKKDIIQLVRSIDFYGYNHLYGVCTTNLPGIASQVRVAIGINEIVFFHHQAHSQEIVKRFALICIKSWKISTASQELLDESLNRLKSLSDSASSQSQSCSESESPDHEHPVESFSSIPSQPRNDQDNLLDASVSYDASLSFEYMNITSRQLDVVEIKNPLSDQIIFLSMSLKSMADEIVSQKALKNLSTNQTSEASACHNENPASSQSNTNASPVILNGQQTMFYCSNIRDEDL